VGDIAFQGATLFLFPLYHTFFLFLNSFLKFLINLLILNFRAIRTRTVDLLGKTDQTFYYQNDPNCFKDPTCIFLHWAFSLTDENIS